jgi:precorrin-8X/cobalt-precorrin-8 methylmutase
VFEYEKVPAEIYRQSFDIIAREANLARFSADERDLVIRLIHACGMVDLADDVVISPGAVAAGINALEAGAVILCDVEMVNRGIIRSRLGGDNAVLCKIGSDEATHLSASLNTTRSAGAIEALGKQIPGAIVAIGNAPTALFHLLEMLQQGLHPPALIIGCPVGFVGAVESKEALVGFGVNQSGPPFITVRGRRGGSAMAAAAVNALSGKLAGLKRKQIN